MSPSWPFIRAVNWKHDAPNPPAALQKMRFTLSHKVANEIVDRQPQIVQVWLEPTAPAEAGQFEPLRVLPGRCEVRSALITWSPLVTRGLGAALKGKRILVRVHCGLFFDTERRIFSAAPDALVSITSPHTPGGVWEGWFTLAEATPA